MYLLSRIQIFKLWIKYLELILTWPSLVSLSFSFSFHCFFSSFHPCTLPLLTQPLFGYSSPPPPPKKKWILFFIIFPFVCKFCSLPLPLHPFPLFLLPPPYSWAGHLCDGWWEDLGSRRLGMLWHGYPCRQASPLHSHRRCASLTVSACYDWCWNRSTGR